MPITPKQLANLKPIEKGRSGNPAGKPKGTLNSKTIIQKWLEAISNETDPVTGHKTKMSQYDAIVAAQVKKAKKGDTQAFNALLDRTEGKPKTSLDINGNIGLTDGPITFE